MATWTEAVRAAVAREAARSSDGTFTRESLLANELDRMIGDVGSAGATPAETVSRELQALRDTGALEFVDDRGTYRWKS